MASEELDIENMSEEELDQLLESEFGSDEEIDEDGGASDDTGSDELDDENLDGSDEGSDDSDKVGGDDEDTEVGDEGSDDEDTNGDSDDETVDTSDDESADEGGDSQVDSETGEGEVNDGEGEDDDTKDTSSADTAINTEEFNKYKSFYDKVTSDFKANGQIVKGITDPDKFIMAQQKAYGIDKKYQMFKKDKPVLLTLEKYGMRNDEEKLSMALAIAAGDKEALKAHMKALDIDPYELDMEEIKYSNENRLVSQSAIDAEDTIEMARSYGVEDKVKQVFGEEWDESGFEKIMKNPVGKNAIMEHMSDGRYEMVMDKINELSRIDVSGRFEAMDSYDKYDYAMKEIGKEQEAASAKTIDASKVEEEKAKIAEEKKQEQYRASLEKKNKKIDEDRKKANSLSSNKKSSERKPKTIDPLKLSDEEMDEMLNSW